MMFSFLKQNTLRKFRKREGSQNDAKDEGAETVTALTTLIKFNIHIHSLVRRKSIQT